MRTPGRLWSWRLLVAWSVLFVGSTFWPLGDDQAGQSRHLYSFYLDAVTGESPFPVTAFLLHVAATLILALIIRRAALANMARTHHTTENCDHVDKGGPRAR